MGHERGFSLIETIVAVAIIAMLLLAGGWWMLSFRGGALRAAADGFDSSAAAARSLAAASGNGATLAFVPRLSRDGKLAPGFVLKVYRGRPTALNAVTDAQLGSVISDAGVSEQHFGKPPFAIFFNSAGMPTGTAAYPEQSETGAVTFPPIAQQPPCPPGGIVLTFRSPQGASDTRSLSCDAVASGGAQPGASPTPNAPGVSPASVVSHWVTGAPPLKFAAAEFGYTHWFASNDNACNGIAPYAAGWPYAPPQNAAEAGVAPGTPAVPYSWPNNGGGSMNDAPAPFLLQPAAAGVCDTAVSDEYGQVANVHVQVMSDLYIVSLPPPGDLSKSPAEIDFTSPSDAPVTIVVGKTYDSEPVRLLTGGSCGTIPGNAFLTMSNQTLTTPNAPGSTPSTSSFTVAPNGRSGSCDLTLIDPYAGSPNVRIHIVVNAPMSVEPQAIEYPAPPAKYIPYPSGVPVAFENDGNSSAIAAEVFNALLGGGTAAAAGAPAPGTPCSALAFTDDTFTTLDAGHDGDIGTQGGCWVADTNGHLATSLPGLPGVLASSGILQKGYKGEGFQYLSNTCSDELRSVAASNNDQGPAALLALQQTASARPGGCVVVIADSKVQAIQKPVAAKIISTACLTVCYAVINKTFGHTLKPPCAPLLMASGDCPPDEVWFVSVSYWYQSIDEEASWQKIGASSCVTGLNASPTELCDPSTIQTIGEIPKTGGSTTYTFNGSTWLNPPGAPAPNAPSTSVNEIPRETPTPAN